MNDPSKAEKIIVKLIEQDSANYPKLLELIKIYLKAGDVDSATRILSITTENLLAAGQEEKFSAELNEILTRNPEQLDALRLLIRYHGWKRDSAEIKSALERLAEAARHQDAVEDERFALVQLVMIEPQNAEFAQRLQEIKTDTGDFSQAVLPIQEFSAEPDTPVFETFSGDEDDEINPAKITSFESFESFYGDENDYSDDASNNNGYHVEATVIEDFAPESESADFQEETEFAEHIYESDEPELSPAKEIKLEQEIESIQFYISQKYYDLADKSLAFLKDEFGNRPEIAELRCQIDGLSPKKETESVVSEFEESGEKDAHPIEENIATPIVLENAAAIEPEEASVPAMFNDFDDFKNELGFAQTEAKNISDEYETHLQLATAYQEMGLMEDAIREFQDAINLVVLNDGTRRFLKCANLLGHCFTESGMPNLALIWYQRALENTSLDDDEKQALYYEIGKVYEAGGEDEKALEYFEQIYALDVDYRDATKHLERLREKLAVSAA